MTVIQKLVPNLKMKKKVCLHTVCVRVFMCVCVCVYVCVSVLCVCILLCIYMYTLYGCQ